MIVMKNTLTEYKDCFVKIKGTVVTVGNRCITRSFDAHTLTFLETTDPKRRKKYTDNVRLTIPMVDTLHTPCFCTPQIANHNGVGNEHLCVALEYRRGMDAIVVRLSVYPELPFVTTRISVFASEPLSYPSEMIPAARPFGEEYPNTQVLDGVGFGGANREMTIYRFSDQSDLVSQPLRKEHTSLYYTGSFDERGGMFHVVNRNDNEELLLVKHAPVGTAHLFRETVDLRIDGSVLRLLGTGVDLSNLPAGETDYYFSTVGVGRRLIREYRELMRRWNRGNGMLTAISNTWGDRSDDKKLCDDFICQEIDVAAELGLDIVQIDDGWPKGTVETKAGFINHVWEGYYDEDPDYWVPYEGKFPKGFSVVQEHAAEKGVKLGLWFSPDSSGDVKNWKRDLKTLYDFYEKNGFVSFKLDGVTVRSKAGERNLESLLMELCRRDGRALHIDVDVTAGRRPGFTFFREYGTLFLENRYTDFGTYYPHSALRNLWLLSEVLPTRQLRLEFLNHRRNADKYGKESFAPSEYDIQYLFATTMMANPLAFMELTGLAKEDIAPLASIISVWKEHRDALYNADVIPVGDEPNGTSFTGFYADCGDSCGYILAFRETCDKTQRSFAIPTITEQPTKITVLASNAPAKVTAAKRAVHVRLGAKRSFVFAKIEK